MTGPKPFSGKGITVSAVLLSIAISMQSAASQAQSTNNTSSSNTQTRLLVRASSSSWARMKAEGKARQLHAGSSKDERTYDAQGRLIKVLEPNQDGKLTLETDYTWNTQGKLAQIVQHGQNGDAARTRTFTYDKLNHLISSSSPESGTTTYTYASNGKVATKTDARGIVTSYTWDAKGNLIGKQYSNGDPSVVYVYDDKTNKLTASYFEAAGGIRAKRTYFYNDKGRLDHLVQQGKKAYSVSLAYDASGHISEIHYPDGRIVLVQHDDSGRISSITDKNGTTYLSKVEYSATNALKSAQLGNSLTVKTGFNHQGTLSKLRVLRWSDQPVIDKHFSYTRDGSISHIKDNLNPANSLVYSYDNLRRVAGYAEPEGELKHDYSYDTFGNIDLKEDLPFQQIYDAENKISAGSGLTYDQAGEMTFDGTHQYQYDAEGRIVRVDDGAIQYIYSAEGDRLQKHIGKAVIEEVPLGSDLLAERAADGSWTDYLYANGRRIAAIRTTGVSYYVADPLGTTRTEFSASGEVLAQSDVTPFGKAIHSSSAQAVPFTSGEQYDTETGLNSYKYRSYNPTLGRWMSPDPSGERYANLKNPQTLNLYAFVANNPLKYTDLLGLSLSGACTLDPVDSGDDGDQNDDGYESDDNTCGNGGDGNGGDGASGSKAPDCNDDNTVCVVDTPNPPSNCNDDNTACVVDTPDPTPDCNDDNTVCVVDTPDPTNDPDDPGTCNDPSSQEQLNVSLANTSFGVASLATVGCGTSLASRERILENRARNNIEKYKKNNVSLANGDSATSMRMVAQCDNNNHSCTYTLSGTSNTYYIWEHQTAGGGGRTNVGLSDNISGGTSNTFSDMLTGSNETYRFFTLSTNPNYNSANQIPVMVQEDGQTFEFEHIYNESAQ